jgi:acetyl esterase/lipase
VGGASAGETSRRRCCCGRRTRACRCRRRWFSTPVLRRDRQRRPLAHQPRPRQPALGLGSALRRPAHRRPRPPSPVPVAAVRRRLRVRRRSSPRGPATLLLSDNVRMHRHLRAAGVAAELHVWEASGHGGFLGMAPEDADRVAELRRFVDEHAGPAPPPPREIAAAGPRRWPRGARWTARARCFRAGTGRRRSRRSRRR